MRARPRATLPAGTKASSARPGCTSLPHFPAGPEHQQHQQQAAASASVETESLTPSDQSQDEAVPLLSERAKAFPVRGVPRPGEGLLLPRSQALFGDSSPPAHLLGGPSVRDTGPLSQGQEQAKSHGLFENVLALFESDPGPQDFDPTRVVMVSRPSFARERGKYS